MKVKASFPTGAAVGAFALLATAALLTLGTGHAEADPVGNCIILPFEALGGCVAPASGGKSDDTQIYTGLQVAFGNGKFVPKLVLGVRHTKASNDNVYGVDASARFAIQDKLSFDSSVFSVVGGRGNVLGNAGIGYSYADKSMMTTAALETAHLRGGVDYVFSLSSPTFFIETNTIEKHEGSATACEEGYYSLAADNVWTPGGPKPELNVGDFQVTDPEAALNGVTCVPTINPFDQ